nr:hypothetical protein CFP56_38794 [Quercus suber]
MPPSGTGQSHFGDDQFSGGLDFHRARYFAQSRTRDWPTRITHCRVFHPTSGPWLALMTFAGRQGLEWPAMVCPGGARPKCVPRSEGQQWDEWARGGQRWKRAWRFRQATWSNTGLQLASPTSLHRAGCELDKRGVDCACSDRGPMRHGARNPIESAARAVSPRCLVTATCSRCSMAAGGGECDGRVSVSVSVSLSTRPPSPPRRAPCAVLRPWLKGEREEKSRRKRARELRICHAAMEGQDRRNFVGLGPDRASDEGDLAGSGSGSNPIYEPALVAIGSRLYPWDRASLPGGQPHYQTPDWLHREMRKITPGGPLRPCTAAAAAAAAAVSPVSPCNPMGGQGVEARRTGQHDVGGERLTLLATGVHNDWQCCRRPGARR